MPAKADSASKRACLTCKYPICIINTFLLLIGAAATIVGVWVLADTGSLVKYIPINDEVLQLMEARQQLRLIGSVMAAAGSLLVIGGGIGCVGALSENRWLLGVYVGFLVIVIVAQNTVAVYSYINFPALEDAISTTILTDLTTNYPNSTYITDVVMRRFNCCGWNHYGDFIGSKFDNDSNISSIPSSCCAPVPGKRMQCDSKSSSLFTNGCKSVLVAYIGQLSKMILFAAITIAFVECLILVVSLWLWVALGGKRQLTPESAPGTAAAVERRDQGESPPAEQRRPDGANRSMKSRPAKLRASKKGQHEDRKTVAESQPAAPSAGAAEQVAPVRSTPAKPMEAVQSTPVAVQSAPHS